MSQCGPVPDQTLQIFLSTERVWGKSHTIELLLRVIASGHWVSRQRGWLVCNVIHSAMAMGQTGCASRPRATPEDQLPQMGHSAVAREFAAAANTQLSRAPSPFREARLVAIILDPVTIWGRQLIQVSTANALLRGVKTCRFRSAATSAERCRRTRLCRVGR
jgi:hypothetical protein